MFGNYEGVGEAQLEDYARSILRLIRPNLRCQGWLVSAVQFKLVPSEKMTV